MPPLLGPRVAEAAWRRGIARAPRTSLMSQRTGFAGCQSRLTTTAALSLVPLRYRDTGGDRHLDPGERSHVSHGCTRRTGTIDHTAQECRAHLNAPGRCLALVSYVIFYDTFMIPIVLITVKRIAELCIIYIKRSFCEIFTCIMTWKWNLTKSIRSFDRRDSPSIAQAKALKRLRYRQ